MLLKPNVKVIPLIISIMVRVIICILPKLGEMPQNGWHLLAVFMSIIVACAIGGWLYIVFEYIVL